MAGKRYDSAWSASSLVLALTKGDDRINNALTPCLAANLKADSTSALPRISTTTSLRPRTLAADSTDPICVLPMAGSQKTATLEIFGMASFSASSHFLLKSAKSKNTPVILPRRGGRS